MSFCPKCDKESLTPFSKESRVEQKYDYKLTTQIFYYKCELCDKMFDEVVTHTGIRNLALNRYQRAKELLNN